MQIGKVIGTLVATKKHHKMEGAKLLLVQPMTLEGTPRGVAVLAIDSVGAGVGEKVLIVLEAEGGRRCAAAQGGSRRCRDHRYYRYRDGGRMNEQELRSLVRTAVARHLGTSAPPMAAADSEPRRCRALTSRFPFGFSRVTRYIRAW